MSLPIVPPLGHHIPDAHHAVSVQLTKWKDMCGMVRGEARVKDIQLNGYPRSFIHRDIKELAATCMDYLGRDSKIDDCLLFPNRAAAVACQEFVLNQGNGYSVDPTRISILFVGLNINGLETAPALSENSQQQGHIQLAVFVFPREATVAAMTLWRLTGQGISSRLAERCLQNLNSLAQVTDLEPTFPGYILSSAHETVCERIADLLNRTTANPLQQAPVSKSDVYLYQSGMSAIYHVQQLLLGWRGSESIVFGFPYELTLKLVRTYGPSCKFFAFGTSQEMDELEAYLEAERKSGRKVQAVWCECPSNPLLRTVDLHRIKQLADKYDFAIVVDETIGSFANVDLLRDADIIVTSLTKSFNGNADVLAGSVVFNPSSRFYDRFKHAQDRSYRNDLFVDDAIQLEFNSRNFLDRVTKLNDTAQYLVESLEPFLSESSNPITALYYPSTCWSRKNYESVMRPATKDFTPGYGGLFTIEFDTVETAAKFFDELNVHKGPSLGAGVTLAQPYVQTVFHKEKEWAAKFGLKETIVRISVGLEDRNALRETFEVAVREAVEMKARMEEEFVDVREAEGGVTRSVL